MDEILRYPKHFAMQWIMLDGDMGQEGRKSGRQQPNPGPGSMSPVVSSGGLIHALERHPLPRERSEITCLRKRTGELRRKVEGLKNSVGESMGNMDGRLGEVGAVVEVLLACRGPSPG